MYDGEVSSYSDLLKFSPNINKIIKDKDGRLPGILIYNQKTVLKTFLNNFEPSKKHTLPNLHWTNYDLT